MGFRWLIVALLALSSPAPSAEKHPHKPVIRHPLSVQHLDAVHQTRIDLMKRRLVLPELGVYQDFRAVLHAPGALEEAVAAAKADDVQIVLQSGSPAAAQTGTHGGILFLAGFPDPGQEWKLLTGVPRPPSAVQPKEVDALRRDLDNPKSWKKLLAKMKDYPDEAFAALASAVPEFPAKWDSGLGQSQKTPFDPYTLSFRHASIHVMARELTEAAVRESLAAGRTYVAEDWLCDPSHPAFVAVNELGVFDVGDHVPLTRRTFLEAHLPVPAQIQVIRNGQTAFEIDSATMQYLIREPGAYRLEITIKVDGEDRPWIATNSFYVLPPRSELLPPPPTEISANVQVFRNIAYTSGDPRRLDLYIPRGRKGFPLLLFLPGDPWRAGDRAVYTAFGNRFAKAGLGVAIPSYRSTPPPAQIEDAAALFAWVRKFIAKYSGDPHRIFLGGHSSGGRLATLLALNPRYLEPFALSPADIKGVVALSGLYDAGDIAALGPGDPSKRDGPPSLRVRTASPPFLIAYCQWDYPAVPYRARQLYSVLRQTFVPARLVYIPNENHLSEIVNAWRDDDPIAHAILQMVNSVH